MVLVQPVKSVGQFKRRWCSFECLKAAGIISYSFVAIWKSKMALTYKDGPLCMYTRFWSQYRIQLADSNGVACFKRYCNIWPLFGSPPTGNFFNALLGLCVPSPLSSRLLSFLLCVIVWSLDGRLVAGNSYISNQRVFLGNINWCWLVV